MKFRRAFHKIDAAGVTQTIGVAESGRLFFGHGLDTAERGEFFAEWTPDDALKFAFELANLARYAKTVNATTD